MHKRIISISLFLIWSCTISAQNIFRTACQGKLNRLDSMLQEQTIAVSDDRGRSLLHWAVACKRQEIVRYLVEKGIDINQADHEGKTATYVAVQYQNEAYFDLMKSLQANSGWIKKQGPLLLERAILNESTLFVKKLIEAGADINQVNQRGSTPLEIAQRIGASEISQILLELGADAKQVRDIKRYGAYMGQVDPGLHPQLFAPNFISTEESEFGFVFNAAGTECYFGVDVNGRNEIRFSELIDNKWTGPKVILAHEIYGYNDPFLSNDEQRLYCISSQTLDGEGEKKDIDIWYIEKEDDGWSAPINAGTTINTEGNEYYISFTKDGTMYFASDGHADDGKNPDHDIYYSKYIDGNFQKPVALGAAINTEAYEADVFIAPDESYIIFCSTRAGGYGRGDLYISFKNRDGAWTPAVNMGASINTSHYEYCPFVSKDGKYLFYTSQQDIYWVSTDIFAYYKHKK